jgi:Regulator of volume decrease after cellular swelling
MLVVTSEQLLFWQQVNEEGVQPAAAPHYDLSVDAVCIDLHALVNDNSNSQSEDENVQETSPPSAVYIQMSRNDGDEADPGEENDADLMELTIHFAAANDEQVGDDKSSTEETTAQALFEAITKLISMHPINPNDGIDQPDGADSRPTTWYGAEEFGASNGNDQYGDAEDYDDDEEEYYDNDDDMYVASNGNNNSGDQGATEEERNAMLERLDRLLIVPIELEQNDSEGEVELVERGQFDDADDNEIVEML